MRDIQQLPSLLQTNINLSLHTSLRMLNLTWRPCLSFWCSSLSRLLMPCEGVEENQISCHTSTLHLLKMSCQILFKQSTWYKRLVSPTQHVSKNNKPFMLMTQVNSHLQLINLLVTKNGKQGHGRRRVFLFLKRLLWSWRSRHDDDASSQEEYIPLPIFHCHSKQYGHDYTDFQDDNERHESLSFWGEATGSQEWITTFSWTLIDDSQS